VKNGNQELNEMAPQINYFKIYEKH
jgi:hypothetical protein